MSFNSIVSLCISFGLEELFIGGSGALKSFTVAVLGIIYDFIARRKIAVKKKKKLTGDLTLDVQISIHKPK